MDNTHDSRSELERLAGNPVAREEWEEARRIEDAIDSTPVPPALHARIMARVAADRLPVWARGGGLAPHSTRLPLWALGAAAVLFVAVAGVENQRTRISEETRHTTTVSLPAAPSLRLHFPDAMMEVARPANFVAEGRDVTEFAHSLVSSAVSPFRSLPIVLDDHSGEDNSMMNRERSS